MEFLPSEEVFPLLKDHGVTPSAPEEDRVGLAMADHEHVVRLHLAADGSTTEPRAEARVVSVKADALPNAIEAVIHKLHLTQVLLIPVGLWRHVFDAVAFSLAENEDWQEFDHAATVKRNTRDPLLCEPGDYQTVHDLFTALISDADQLDQGLMLTSTASPVLVEFVPDGVVRLCFGNQALADEVAEALEV